MLGSQKLPVIKSHHLISIYSNVLWEKMPVFHCSKPLFTYEAYNYGVCALRMVSLPAHSVDVVGGESLSVPAFTGIFSAFRMSLYFNFHSSIHQFE